MSFTNNWQRQRCNKFLEIDFTVVAADIDESSKNGESAFNYVERLAREKSRHVAQANPEAVILAADTSVIVDDFILGKPGTDARLGVSMQRRLILPFEQVHDQHNEPATQLAAVTSSHGFNLLNQVRQI